MHELRGHNSDHQAGPVRDGIAKKGAPMSVGIGVDVEHNPAEQDDGRDDAQRVVAKEGAFTILFHKDSMMNVRAR